MRGSELKALTSLRGIAAMAIVLQHFSATAALISAGWIPSLVPHGYMAVDFFFVLSGFIMAYTYLAAFEARGSEEYWPFLYKRIARIFPLGIAVTLLILAGALVASMWGRPGLFIPAPALAGDLTLATLVNVAHLQGFFPRYSLNGPSWSVSLEMSAYLLFPTFIHLFFGPRRQAVLATAACLATLALVHSCMPTIGGEDPVAWNLARCLAEFCLGLVAYRACRDSVAVRALGLDRWTIAITASTILSGLLRLDLLTALLFPPLVLAFALNRGHAARLLASPVPYFLGVISFSVYLVHNMLRAPLAAAIVSLHPDKLAPAQALVFAIVGSLLVLPVAAASYFLIEKPGRIALNRLIPFVSRNRLAQLGAD